MSSFETWHEKSVARYWDFLKKKKQTPVIHWDMQKKAIFEKLPFSETSENQWFEKIDTLWKGL